MKKLNELPFVSVVIPAYNAAATISDAIEAVMAQDYPDNRLEVIVVDDGSTDQTREIVRQYPVRLVHFDRNMGPSAARNAGAGQASGEIFAATDADDKVDRGWLTNIVSGYEKPDIGAVVGSSHASYDTGDWQQRVIAELGICLRSGKNVEKLYSRHGYMDKNKSAGSNLSFRKSVFEQIGGYDASLWVGEEQDILWRVERAGYGVAFEPDAIVYVQPRQQLSDYFRQVYHHSAEGVAFNFRYPARVGIRYLFNAVFLPALAIILALGLALDNTPLLYSSLVIIVSPLAFYGIQLLRVRRHILKIRDYFLIPLIGYLSFILAAAGVIKGFFRYLCHQRQKGES
ncbi:glycosyltransferase [Chloroflexota bacterium]